MCGFYPAPGDYVDLNTKITFISGQSTGGVACAVLVVVDDDVVEKDEESLSLTLSADEPLVTTTTVVAATVTIKEKDNDGKVQVIQPRKTYMQPLILPKSKALVDFEDFKLDRM